MHTWRSRLIAVLAGILLASAAGSLLTHAMNLSELQVAGTRIFDLQTPFTIRSPLEAGRDPQEGVYVVGARRATLSVIETSGAVRFDFQLEIARDHPLAVDVGEGRFRNSPAHLAGYIAVVTLGGASGEVQLEWTNPTLEMSEAPTVQIQVSGRTSGALPQELFVQIETPHCLQNCTGRLTVTTSTLSVATASPHNQVLAQGPFSLEADLKTESHFLLSLGAGPSELLTRPTLREELNSWLESAAFAFWPLVPWLLFWKAVVGRNRGDPGTRATIDAIRLLLLFGFVLIIVRSLSYVRLDPLWFAVGKILPAELLMEYLPFGAPFPLPPLILSVAIMFVWVRIWSKANRVGKGLAAGVYPALALSLGVLCIVAVHVVAQQGPDQGPRILGTNLALALTGSAVALMGLDLILLGLQGSDRSGLSATLGVWGVFVTLVAMSSTPSDWSQPVTAAFTLVAATAACVAFLWVSARGALGAERYEIWRGKAAVRLTVVGVSVVAVLPEERPPGVPLADLAASAYQVAWNMTTWLSLSLVLMGIVFMRNSALHELNRLAAASLAAALMLRPEVLFGFVPVAALLGFGLIWAVFLPKRSTSSRNIRPRRGQGEQPAMRHAVEAIIRVRAQRELSDSLRRKVTLADLPADDAEKARKIVSDAFGGKQGLPPDDEQIDALAWAGEPSPWRRARANGIVGALIGLILSFSYFAETLTALSGIGRGPITTLASVLVAFKYPFYGLVFGFLYPMIPGRTGLSKASRLFVVIVSAELIGLLLPFQASEELGAAIALRLTQILTLCLVLGVRSDYGLLRKAGYGISELRDLYDTSRFVIWSSGLLVGAVTAAATALLGSATSLLLENLLPEPQNPPITQTDTRQTDSSP